MKTLSFRFSPWNVTLIFCSKIFSPYPFWSILGHTCTCTRHTLYLQCIIKQNHLENKPSNVPTGPNYKDYSLLKKNVPYKGFSKLQITFHPLKTIDLLQWLLPSRSPGTRTALGMISWMPNPNMKEHHFPIYILVFPSNCITKTITPFPTVAKFKASCHDLYLYIVGTLCRRLWRCRT